ATSIGRFLVAHPGVSVDLVSENQGAMRMDENFNFRIFYADRSDATFVGDRFEARELCGWINLPLCSPEYKRKLPSLMTDALRRAHLLHDRDSQFWKEWLASVKMDGEIDTNRGAVFNSTSFCLAAAIAGAGIAIGDSFVAYTYLRDGTLVPPF